MSVEDQNLNLLVRDKEGREEEEEEGEEEEGEGRSFSWLLLRRKLNRFWEGAESEKKKIKEMIKQYTVKNKMQTEKLVWLAFVINNNAMRENLEKLNKKNRTQSLNKWHAQTHGSPRIKEWPHKKTTRTSISNKRRFRMCSTLTN